MIGTSEHYPAVQQDSSSHSGVSWAAIFAGAAAAASLSLLLIMLGAGLGFSAVSPWAGEGIGAKGLRPHRYYLAGLNPDHCLGHGRLPGGSLAG